MVLGLYSCLEASEKINEELEVDVEQDIKIVQHGAIDQNHIYVDDAEEFQNINFENERRNFQTGYEAHYLELQNNLLNSDK